ncbi:MAG: acyl-ACP thioesterase [Spirochaetales bacterium]|nr:acyl-ACP thioesterase [Spirochaetales bacterium]
MNEYHEEEFRACAWDVDRADRLTMAAAYNYCQEVAGNHASLLGVGSTYMKANGIVWILSRMSAVLDERPPSGTKVIVRTWPRGTDRLFVVRDYELRNEAGAVFGRGRSAWLIVDATSFRPRRPEAIVAGLPVNASLDALPDGARALAAAEHHVRAGGRSVAYSDLDYNGHMNNARYVQWIQDALEPDALADALAMRLDINYLAELRPGASADLFQSPLPATEAWPTRVAVEGRTTAEGTVSFRAELGLGACRT